MPETPAQYRVQRLARRRNPYAVVRVGPKGSRILVVAYPTELAAHKVAGLLSRLEETKS